MNKEFSYALAFVGAHRSVELLKMLAEGSGSDVPVMLGAAKVGVVTARHFDAENQALIGVFKLDAQFADITRAIVAEGGIELSFRKSDGGASLALVRISPRDTALQLAVYGPQEHRDGLVSMVTRHPGRDLAERGAAENSPSSYDAVDWKITDLMRRRPELSYTAAAKELGIISG